MEMRLFTIHHFPKYPLLLGLFIAAFTYSGIGQNIPAVKTANDDTETQANERQLRRNAAIDNLILRARSLPAEISIDILFNMLSSDVITERAKRKEVIEDIYSRASEVREPFKLVKHEGLNDTRSGYRAMAFELSLDRLSVRLRAVLKMLAIDKTRARAMFDEISTPKLEPLSCNDRLTYAIREFYQVLKLIAELTFNAEQRGRNEHIYYAASFVEAITSPLQIAPVIDLLASMKTTPQQLDILLSRFNFALRKMSGDPRSFGTAMKYGRINEKLKFSLIDKIERSGFSSKQFLSVYRSFLAKHLSGIQCEDSLITRTESKANPLIEATDTLFTTPLTPDEAKPEKIEPGPSDFRYWTTPKAARLLTNIKKLRFGDENKRLTEEQKDTQEWKESLLKFLEEMDEWLPDDEATGEDYLHQRAVLYGGLLEITPESMLPQILMNYLIFLRESSLMKDTPAQWLVYAKFLMKTGNKLVGDEHKRFAAMLADSGNEVFQVYVDLEQLRSQAK